jgi:hypothetical protein
MGTRPTNLALGAVLAAALAGEGSQGMVATTPAARSRSTIVKSPPDP